MLKRFKAIFAPSAVEAPDQEAALRRAAAAILAEAGLSDGEYDAAEQAVARAALGRLYGLDAAAATALAAEGEAAAREAVDHHRFTAALKKGATVEERAAFLGEVWRVVLADGVRDPHEDAFMRKLAGLLQVPDRDSALARKRAERS